MNDRPLDLVVDTSIKGVSIALLRQGVQDREVLYQDVEANSLGSAGYLTKSIKNAFQTRDYTLDDINRIVIATGPGTFTGIKVGLAWVSGLFAPRQNSIKCMGTSSLEAAASRYSKQNNLNQGVVIFLAATKTHGFLAVSGLKEKRSLLVSSNDESSHIQRHKQLLRASKVLVCGDWLAIEAALEEFSVNFVKLSVEQTMTLALEGMMDCLQEAKADDFETGVPQANYMRKSTAEEQLDKKMGLHE